MKKKKEKNNFGKWLIFNMGFTFVVYFFFLLTLVIFGENKLAAITSYRQEYGERNETIRNQYTYEFAYEFTVNGKIYSGTGQKIGSPVFLKSGPGKNISIKYLKCCPMINSNVEGRKTWINILISLGVGIVLFWFSGKM